MKDTRTPVRYPADAAPADMEQALMNDQDALRAEAGTLAAEAAAAGDATSWFELLYQAAARGEAAIPWASLAPSPHLVQWAGPARCAAPAGPPWSSAAASATT